MNRRSLVLLTFFCASLASAAPQPLPSPSPSPQRLRIADLDHAGATTAERHPWIGQIENFIEVCLLFVGIHRR